jgi:hypothetical protein
MKAHTSTNGAKASLTSNARDIGEEGGGGAQGDARGEAAVIGLLRRGQGGGTHPRSPVVGGAIAGLGPALIAPHLHVALLLLPRAAPLLLAAPPRGLRRAPLCRGQALPVDAGRGAPHSGRRA